jgi:hypothetical protein
VHLPSNFGIATGALIEERDDWSAAVQKARADGWRLLELTAITEERLRALVELLRSRPGLLDGFHRVSLHAPVRTGTSPKAVADAIASLPPLEIVVHPGTYAESAPWPQTVVHRLVFENMDNQKAAGRTVDELRGVFDSHPAAGFCLDVAHVWTNDSTLELGHHLLDNFGHLLRQLHVSGIEPDGTHRPTTTQDLNLYKPLLDRCRHVPCLLEADLAGAT